MRVCSLLPGATEIAFALGLGDDVVGVTHECDYPAEARQKPVTLHFLKLIVVKVIAVLVLRTEEEPVLSFRAGCFSLL